MKSFLVPLLIFSFIVYQAKAQKPDFLQQLTEEELSVVETISLYPESERTQILKVSTYPEILVRMHKNTPEGLQHDLDSLGVIVAEQKANELKEREQDLIFILLPLNWRQSYLFYLLFSSNSSIDFIK